MKLNREANPGSILIRNSDGSLGEIRKDVRAQNLVFTRSEGGRK